MDTATPSSILTIKILFFDLRGGLRFTFVRFNSSHGQLRTGLSTFILKFFYTPSYTKLAELMHDMWLYLRI